MIELVYHKGKMLLPQSFDECTGKQFIELSALKFAGGDEVKCKVKALKILCGFSAFKFLLLKPRVINNALNHIDWVFKDDISTKQLLPSYKGYYGPTSDFDNLRMKEFHMSEIHFKQ